MNKYQVSNRKTPKPLKNKGLGVLLKYYIINPKALALETAKPFVAPQCDGFNDSMFLNENASFQMPVAFRRRSTAVGLKLLYHLFQFFQSLIDFSRKRYANKT